MSIPYKLTSEEEKFLAKSSPTSPGALAVAEIKLAFVTGGGAFEAFLIHKDIGGEVFLYAASGTTPVSGQPGTTANITNCSILNMMAWCNPKPFSDMLSATKYVYGCMRRKPTIQWVMPCIADDGQIHYADGDFSTLRRLLFSTASNVPLGFIDRQSILGAFMSRYKKIREKPSKGEDMFEEMRRKLKAQQAAKPDDTEDVDAAVSDKEDDVGVRLPKEPAFRSAKDFLTKYKNRAPAVDGA